MDTDGRPLSKFDNIAKLDAELARVQKSTRTLWPIFGPIHNWLRMVFRWYYKWHLNPFSTALDYIFLVISVILIVGSTGYVLFGRTGELIRAASSQTWGLQSGWDGWQLSGITKENNELKLVSKGLITPSTPSEQNSVVSFLAQKALADGPATLYETNGVATIKFTPFAQENVDWLSYIADEELSGQTIQKEFSTDNILWTTDVATLADSSTLYLRLTFKSTEASVTPILHSLDLGYSRLPKTPSDLSVRETKSYLVIANNVLSSSPFSDPDNDLHQASQWQVTDKSGDYGSPILDSGIDKNNLTSYDLPKDFSGSHYFRVRYQDTTGAWSLWSQECAFTLTTEQKQDPSLTDKLTNNTKTTTIDSLGGSSILENPNEEISQRTENTKTIDNKNGTKTLESYSGLIHYKENYADPSAIWKDINPNHSIDTPGYVLYDQMPSTVKVFKDKIGYEIESRQTGEKYTVELQGVDGTPKLSTTSKNTEYGISNMGGNKLVSWADINSQETSNKQQETKKLANWILPQALAEDTATVKDDGNLKFEFQISPYGVRLWKTIQGDDAPKNFTWKVTKTGIGSTLQFRDNPEAFVIDNGVEKPDQQVTIQTKKTDVISNQSSPETLQPSEAFTWTETAPSSDLKIDTDVDFNPDADGAYLATSMDGEVARDPGYVDWSGVSGIRDGAGTYARADLPNIYATDFYYLSSGTGWIRLSRSIFTFDTSTLPDDATISAATLKVYGSGKLDDLGITPDINVYESNPDSANALVTSDYSTLGTTALSTAIDYLSFVVNDWNNFVLNATGRTKIDVSGVTKLGLRNANYDVANSEPTPAASSSESYFKVLAMEAGTGTAPTLSVTYTAPVDISGTCKKVNESTNCDDSETVKVAVNGTVAAQTGTTVSGAWTISGVSVGPSDIITTWIDGVADAKEANNVTKYDSAGNITGVALYEDHLTLGSDDNQNITNTDLNQYDYGASGDNEDIFFDVGGLYMTMNVGSHPQNELLILAGNTYTPGGSVTVVNIDINGTFTPHENTVNIAGDWDSTGGTFTINPGDPVEQDSVINLNGAGGSTQTIVSSTTFNYLTIVNASAARTVKFTAGTTTTVVGGFNAVGEAGKLVTLTSTTTSPWTIDGSGTVQYADLNYSTKSGTLGCAAYSQSTNGGNTNWTVSAGASCSGIDISGTAKKVDETTNSDDSEVVKVAVNGVAAAQTGTTASGVWTISGVTVASGDVVTVWVDGVADAKEANAVTKYDGSGNITGILLYEDHLTLGSDDNQNISNTDLSQFDNSVSADEDVFFDVSGAALTVDNTNQTTQDEILILAGNTYTPGGTVTVTNMDINGTFVPASNTINVYGSWDATGGTFTNTNSTITFKATGTGKTITSDTKGFNNITFNGVGGGWTAQDDMSVAATFTLTNGTFTAPSGNLNINSTFNINGGTFTHNSGTVNFLVVDADYNITGNGATFNNVTFTRPSGASAPTITLLNSFTVNGTLSASNDANIAYRIEGASAPTLTVKGTLSFPATAATGLTYFSGSGSAAFSINLEGNFNMADSNAYLKANINFTGAGDQTLSYSAGTIDPTNSNWTAHKPSGTIVPNTNITIPLWKVDTADYAGLFKANSTNRITLSNFNQSAGTYTHPEGDFVDFTTLTQSNGIFNASAANMNVYSTFNRSGGTFNHSSGTVTFVMSDSSYNITTGGAIFNNVIFARASGESAPTITLINSFTVNGNLTASNDNTIAYHIEGSGSPTITVNGNLSLPSTAATGVTYFGGSGAANFTVNLGGDINIADAGVTVYANLNFTGAYDQTVTKSAGTIDSNSTWVVNKANSVILASAITGPGSATITAGTLYTAGNTFTPTALTVSGGAILKINGPESITAAPTLSAGSTVEYVGDNVATDTAINSFDYTNANLKINDVNATKRNFTLPNGTRVFATVNIVSGKLDATSSNYNLSVLWHWSNTGTFTPRAGTVTLSGVGGSTQIISGTTTFYNLSATAAAARTINFASGTTQTVTGTWTVTGAAGQLITLGREGGTGSDQWDITPSTANVDYVDVTNSHNNAATLINPTNYLASNNPDNNTNWFPVMSISGICQKFDEVTNCADGETIKVAYNGILKTETAITSGGAWSIGMNTAPNSGDVVTVFVDGVADSLEANAVTKYDGSGNITGMALYEDHLTLGSDDNQNISNTNISQYDNSVSADEDVFFDVSGNALTVDNTNQTAQDEILILTGNTYTPGGNVTVTNVDINGTFVPASNTINVYGSWDATGGTFTNTGSTITFNATTTGKTITSDTKAFNNITFNGVGGGWTAQDNMIAAAFTMINGTLNIASDSLSVAGTLSMAGGIITKASANFTVTANIITMQSGSSMTTTVSGDIALNSTVSPGAFTLDTINSAGKINIGSSTTNTTPLSVTVNNTMTSTNDITIYSDSNITQNGNITTTATYYINLYIDQLNTGGTFTQSSGTLSGNRAYILFSEHSNNDFTLSSINNIGRLYIGRLYQGIEPDVNPKSIVITGPVTVTGATSFFSQSNITQNGDITANILTSAVNFYIDQLNTGGLFIQSSGTVAGYSVCIRFPASSNNDYTLSNIHVVGMLYVGSSSITGPKSLTITGSITSTSNTNFYALNNINQAGNISNAGATPMSLYPNQSSGIYQTYITDDSTISASTYTVNGKLTINSGKTLNANGSAISTTSTFTNNGTLKIKGSEAITAPTLNTGSTVEYAGDNVATDLAIKNFDYTNSNLKINDVNATKRNFTLPNGTRVFNNVNIVSGKLDATASDYNLSVSGNWANTDTFTPRASTVTLSGAGGSTQVISGTTSFNNLYATAAAARTINFASGTTQTVTGTWTVTGAAGQLITLGREGGTGSDQWDITPSTANVDYVDVTNSHNNAATLINPTNYLASNNPDNNTNWFLPPPTAPSAVSIGSLGTTDFTVGWSDNSSDETGFKVYTALGQADCSSIDPGDYTLENTTVADAESQLISSKEVNTQYCAKVVATNSNGDSAAAYSAPTYTLANVPSIPTLAVVSSSKLKITVNQNSNPANTRYAIAASADGGATWNFVKHADHLSQVSADWQLYADWNGASGFENWGLTKNTEYTYKVEAENGDNTATVYSGTTAATTLDTFTITANVNGTGSGTTDAVSPVDAGTGEDITATAAISSVFTVWTGCDSTTLNVCHLTNIIANKTVTATFTLKTYTVTIGTAGNGSGNLDQVTQSVNYGSSLTTTATPTVSSDFTGWSGDASGTGDAVLSNITADKTITATFTLKTYSVTISRTGSGSGTFDQTSGAVDYGTDLDILAVPATDSDFIAWTDCDSVAGLICTLSNVTADKTPSAQFQLKPVATISINSGARKTNSPDVVLTLTTDTAVEMKLGNSLSDLNSSPYEPFALSRSWTLTSGDGTKSLYSQVKDSSDIESVVYSTSIILDTTPPAAPTNLAATSGNASVSLSWTNPADADFARVAIYRSTSAGFIPDNASNQIGNTTSSSAVVYTDTTVENNVTYYYQIKAIDDADNYSTAANEVSVKPDSGRPTTPGKPTVLGKTNIRDGIEYINKKEITLAWSPSSQSGSSLKGYYLSIGTASNSTNVLANQEILLASLSDISNPSHRQVFSNDGIYYARVIAKNNADVASAVSGELTFVVDTIAPLIPGPIIATPRIESAASTFTITLSWSPAIEEGSGLAGYIVYKNGSAILESGEETTRTSPTAGKISYLDHVLSNTSYGYTIKAVDIAGNESVTTVVNSIVSVPAKDANNIVDKIISAVTTPEAVATVSSAAVIIAVAAAAATPLTNAVSLFTFPEFIRSLFYSLISLLTGRKKRKEWGKVVEAGTNTPIPQVKLDLVKVEEAGDQTFRQLGIYQTTFSDKEGNYAFIAEPGIYQISATKGQYHIVAAHSSYRPTSIVVIHDDNEALVVPNIVMSLNENDTISILLRLRRIVMLERVLAVFSIVFLLIGTSSTIYNLAQSRSIINISVAVVYLALWFINIRAIMKVSPFGNIVDENDGQGVPLAMIRVMDSDGKRLIKTTVSNEKGKFQTTVPKGVYNIKVAKAGYEQSDECILDAESKIGAVNRQIDVRKTANE